MFVCVCWVVVAEGAPGQWAVRGLLTTRPRCERGGVTDRWAALFADLEGQVDAEAAAELDAEVRDRARAETARLRLVDRFAPAVGHELSVRTLGAGTARGRLCSVGSDWLLLEDARGAECVVPLAAVVSVGGLGAGSREPGTEGAVPARLRLAHALRGIARSRAPVVITTVDGGVVHGTVDRVGADFVEVAEHPPGEPRRVAAVHGVRTVATAAIATVTAR